MEGMCSYVSIVDQNVIIIVTAAIHTVSAGMLQWSDCLIKAFNQFQE